MALIALCLGSAPSVWEDWRAARTLVVDRPMMVVVCNLTGVMFPGRIDAWATLHPERLAGWRERRRAAGGNGDYRSLAHTAYPGLDAEVEPARWAGSSGLYMADIALGVLGADAAILCGVPLLAEAGHIGAPGAWSAPEGYQLGMESAVAEGANIRSMSGWTAERLGTPTTAWLDGERGSRGPAPERRHDMHVRFLADFDYTPSADPRIQIAYRAGWSGPVRRECGERAIVEGRAEEIDTPAQSQSRDPLDHDGDGRKGGSLPGRRVKRRA